MWATYNLPVSPTAGMLSIGFLQQFASGVPYPAMAIIHHGGALANPGYATPPAAVEYFFLGRDPFRTEATYRTDLAVNYGYRLADRAGFVLSCSSMASC